MKTQNHNSITYPPVLKAGLSAALWRN